MKYCIVELKTQTATFRNPEFQNFHKTLPLPPPTTLVGIAGAAMGKSPEEAQRFFEDSAFEMGVYCTFEGMAKDDWKYRKLNKDKKKDPRDFIEDVLVKEILFNTSVIIVYGSKNNSKSDELRTAFEAPIYGLTMGNSDSLAKVVAIEEETNTIDSDIVSYCLIEGDLIEEVLSNASNGLDFSIYSTSDPIVMDLPTRFAYTDNYGMRSVCKRKQFSLITKEMKLNVKKTGIVYKGIFVPLFHF